MEKIGSGSVVYAADLIPHSPSCDKDSTIPTLDNGSAALVVTSPPYPGQYGNTMPPARWLDWTKNCARFIRLLIWWEITLPL